MSKPVTDPDLLKALNGTLARQPAPVSDPALLAQLNATIGPSGDAEAQAGGFYGPIDFDRPVDRVRADIAKLTGPAREQALRQWADTLVAREKAQDRAPAETAGIEPPTIGQGRIARQRPQQTASPQAAADAGRALARGSFVGPFLDEANAATQGGLYAVSGGMAGAPYDEALAYQRARDRAYDQANPGTSTALRVAGGVAGGIGAARQAGTTWAAPALAAGGPFAVVAPSAGMIGNIGKGAGIGGTYGAVAGFGEGEGGDNRLENALTSGLIGGAVGGVVPPVISGVGAVVQGVANSPTVASLTQGIRNRLADNARPAVPIDQIYASGPQLPLPVPVPRPQLPRVTTSQAAADQAIANQLARANVAMPEVRSRMTQYADALPSGQPSTMVLADVDNSLARLAGTSSRKNPEAANIADAVTFGRQTGETPRGGMPANSGLSTRPAFTAEVPGQPMGQYERVRDALREGLEIPPGSAYRYGESLKAKMKSEADVAYGQLYKEAAGLDVRPSIQPVLDAWKAKARDEPRDVAKAIEAAIKTYGARSGTVGTLERFQKAKEFLDGRITNYMESLGDGRDRYLGGLLSQMQRDLRGAIDGIQTNNIGPKYAAARQQFATDAQQKKAIDLGRKAFKADSEVTADIYGALNPAEQKLFRLGAFESYERNIGGPKRTADITQAFESPRVQQLLQVLMKDDASAKFGQFLSSGEKQFIRTRNEVLGNSKTQQRSEDDAATEGLMGVVDKLRLLRRPVDASIEAISSVLNRAFGFRADTHAQIARQLFTADRAELDAILARVEQRLGPSRYAQFQMMMQQAYGRMAQAGANVAAPAAAQSNQPPRRP